MKMSGASYNNHPIEEILMIKAEILLRQRDAAARKAGIDPCQSDEVAAAGAAYDTVRKEWCLAMDTANKKRVLKGRDGRLKEREAQALLSPPAGNRRTFEEMVSEKLDKSNGSH